MSKEPEAMAPHARVFGGERVKAAVVAEGMVAIVFALSCRRIYGSTKTTR